ncbi:MAG: GNAT family N-acetyltransferase [Candidatus Omnitrophica bacterium]|nr:GNAT family N-acetyltransferase [Candidatus Omnitrophota bacterium]
MHISLATTDRQIEECSTVLGQLRVHLDQKHLFQQIKNQIDCGYQLVRITVDDSVVAVAGFRMSQSLAWGHFLYVDDLVTRDDKRSQGYGHALIEWLVSYAKTNQCDQLHLDSGVRRTDAHRFYENNRFVKTSCHFSMAL